MKILFIPYLPEISNMIMLISSLISDLDKNLLYIIIMSIIILGSINYISYSSSSKLIKVLKNGGKVMLGGATAKAGSDAFDYGKEKVKAVLEDLKNPPASGSNSTPKAGDSSNTKQ